MKKILSAVLALVMTLAIVPTSAFAVDTSGAVSAAQAEASLESTYGINIRFSEEYDEASRLENLDELESSLQLIPAKLRSEVAKWVAARNKKLTVDFTGEYAYGVASFSLESMTINIYVDGIIAPDFPHEYGHLLHNVLNAKLGANTLQKAWTAYNNGVSYGDSYEYGYLGYVRDGPDPIFVSSYASTKYGEDFAETFSYIINTDIWTGSTKDLILHYPNSPAVKKMNYLRQLLCDTFSINPADFPDANPPMPSGWAKEAITEYQNIFDPRCGISYGDYHNGNWGVVPSARTLHDKGYQAGATRMRFAYSMYHDLIDRLWRSKRGKVPDYIYMSQEEHEKWSINPWTFKEDMQQAGITLFTDVGVVASNQDPSKNIGPEAVYALCKNGVVSGTSATTFSPDKTLTRQEAAAMLYRLCGALNYELPRGELTFADSEDIAPWAREAVAAMAASGIMSGVDGNRFAPNDTYTYEQCAVTLLRVYKLLIAERGK